MSCGLTELRNFKLMSFLENFESPRGQCLNCIYFLLLKAPYWGRCIRVPKCIEWVKESYDACYWYEEDECDE
jgi:hypothetical protein